MTYKEALNRFQAMLTECTIWCKENQLAEMFGLAIEALEKQIAVKGEIIIKGKPENGGSYGVRICPSCGKSIDIYGDYKGCPYCLQKVDWSEV